MNLYLITEAAKNLTFVGVNFWHAFKKINDCIAIK